ncbi:MAG: hypothetical protein AAF962_24095 [Actinomycetota bacterium]
MIGLTIIGGLITSAVFTVIILASWRLSPTAWLADVTKGEVPTPRTPANVAWFVLIVLSLVGGAMVTAWLAATEYDAGFFARFAAAWVVVAILNLVDLVVIDIAIYLWMRPSWMSIEGYEMPTDYRMHVAGALTGLAIGIPVGLVAATVSLLA